MNEYYLLKNVDAIVKDITKEAYLEEGFTVFYEDEDTLLVRRLEKPVHALTEKRMLQVILSHYAKTGHKETVTVELSPLMNKHISRLTENDCASLKFHDAFLDELKTLVTRSFIR